MLLLLDGRVPDRGIVVGREETGGGMGGAEGAEGCGPGIEEVNRDVPACPGYVMYDVVRWPG